MLLIYFVRIIPALLSARKESSLPGISGYRDSSMCMAFNDYSDWHYGGSDDNSEPGVLGLESESVEDSIGNV